MGVANIETGEKEVSILASVLGNGQRQLTKHIARYILELGFSEDEKGRMHDLVVRNQKDALNPVEKQELFAFGKAGDILAILKSKARRTLGVQQKPRTVS